MLFCTGRSRGKTERKIRRLFDLDSVTSTAVPGSDVLNCPSSRSKPKSSARVCPKCHVADGINASGTVPGSLTLMSNQSTSNQDRKAKALEIIKFKQFSGRNFNRIAI